MAQAVVTTPKKGIPPWMLAVGAMLCVQVSNALSVFPIDYVGPGGTSWLRLTFGGIILLLWVRPKISKLTKQDLPGLLLLGVITGYMIALFLFAVDRIPLGTAVAIEFLGPLILAGVMSKHKAALIWPALAFVGVVILTEPWQGKIDLIGVLFAVGAGTCWALYNLFTQKIGDRFAGISGLALTIPIAALATMPVGLPEVINGDFHWWILPVTAGIALVTPVIAFGLEMLALKRMTQTAFGTLLAVEPGIATLIGLVALAQAPTWLQLVGIVLVVAAGCAAQRGGARDATPPLAAQPD